MPLIILSVPDITKNKTHKFLSNITGILFSINMKNKKVVIYTITWFVIALIIGLIEIYLGVIAETTTDISLYRGANILSLILAIPWLISAILMIIPEIRETIDDIKHYLNKK